ncbi:MAG: flippase-like domain-containing protein [Firmicutes bacterium]|nr:flippase-like domain-containing protein [Bacillota bacterium]MCM1400669.1 flippase-like domain-containing protein [Bacteroides sp.]MCM1476363.1 flippase-like domain-containing protein [Bacteroides sp.]
MDSQQQQTKDSGTRAKSWLANVLRYGVPFVITVGLCWLLFKNMDFGAMVEAIRERCTWRWIWFGLALSFFSHFIRAARWQIQLRAINVNVGFFPVLLSIFGTYAVNLVFPRLGELWRTGYIAQRQKAPFDKVFGSMVADRLADTVSVALLTLFTFILAGPQLTEYLSQNRAAYETLMAVITSPWTYAAIALIVVAVWALMRRRGSKVTAIKNFCKGLWDGFSVVATMKGRGRWLLLTGALWSCYFFQLYVALFAFPETAEMVHRHGVVAALFCFVVSSISMGVPSNGGIGPWQWAIIFGMSLFSSGVPGLNEVAPAFANLVMGAQTILLILLGIFTFVAIAIGRRKN